MNGNAQSATAVSRRESDLATRRFNHDLLIEPADQEAAVRRWPSIARILVEPELIAAFRPHEEKAKKLKMWVLRLGSCAVILTFIALLGSAVHEQPAAQTPGLPAAGKATDPQGQAPEHGSPLSRMLLESCAVLGLLAAVLASRYGPLRRPWLMHRFMTEVLRQWHFRFLLNGPGISDRLGPHAQACAHARREELSALLHDFTSATGQKMDQLIEKGFDPLGRITRPRLPVSADVRAELLDAYRVLRLDHQRDFAVYKLSADDKTFLQFSGHVLMQAASFLAATTIVFALALSLVGFFTDIAWLPLAIISLTIAGVATRAWRDGLALGEDRERYQDMRHRLDILTARWESATTDQDRFIVAEEMEQTALEELRSFIRAHEKAQFLF
jgi:hypothetical protein